MTHTCCVTKTAQKLMKRKRSWPRDLLVMRVHDPSWESMSEPVAQLFPTCELPARRCLPFSEVFPYFRFFLDRLVPGLPFALTQVRHGVHRGMGGAMGAAMTGEQIRQASEQAAMPSEAAACESRGWRLIQTRDFGLLWWGQVTSQIGEGLNKVALL